MIRIGFLVGFLTIWTVQSPFSFLHNSPWTGQKNFRYKSIIMNATMQKFGYPQTLIKEFKKWVVVLRPQQVTLGSLILICQDDAKAFSDISPEAFSELPQVIKEIESSLSKAWPPRVGCQSGKGLSQSGRPSRYPNIVQSLLCPSG